MNPRSAAEVAGAGVLVVLAGALLGGAALGQPVLLGYVETGSMAPTLTPGDGFVAVPAALAGPVEPGDVVVYEAEVIDGGGLTTHRVVGETGAGYLTRGDANFVTDQDSGEPPVRRGQVVAEALQVGGHVVVIPHVGPVAGGVHWLLDGALATATAVLGAGGVPGSQSLAGLLFAAGVLAYLWTVYAERGGDGGREDRRRTRGDDSIDSRAALVGMAVLLGAVLTGSMLLTDTTHEFGVVSAEQDSGRQYVIERGTTEHVTYTVPSYGVVPATVFLTPASGNVAAEPQELYVPGGASRNATIALTAPDEVGRHPQYLTEHRYLGVLPMGLTRWLHGVHPVLPVVVIDLLVAGGVAGLGWALLGSQRIRLGSRTPDRPLRYRVQRWLR